MHLLKNIFLVVILVAVIVGSFWISFNLGKSFLMPVTKEIKTVDQMTSEADAIIKKIGPVTFEVETGEDSSPVNVNLPAIADLQADEIKTKEVDFMTPKIESKIKKVKKTPVDRAVCAYKVQTGIFSVSNNAEALKTKLQKAGFEPVIEKYGKNLQVYICGESLSDAKMIASRLKAKGFVSVIRRK